MTSTRLDVRQDAIELSGALGARGKALVPTLIEFLADHEGRVATSWHAVGALGKIGPEARGAIPALLAVAADDEIPNNVRQRALIEMAAIDRAGKRIRAGLEEALRSRIDTLIIGAAIALEELGPRGRASLGPLEAALELGCGKIAASYLEKAIVAVKKI